MCSQPLFLCSRPHLEALPLGTRKQAVCLSIIDKPPSCGIPGKRSAQPAGDVAEVAGGGTGVLTDDIGDWLPAGFDAVEEVPHVIHDCLNLSSSLGPAKIIEVVDREGIAGQRVVSQVLDRLAGEAPSVDEDPALAAGEHDAGAAVVSHAHRHATGIAIFHRILQRHVVAVRVGRIPGLATDTDRLAANRPLGDVKVVGPPIGHLATGILKPPAKGEVAPLLDEGHARGLALPEVPVETGRRCRGLKRPADLVSSNHNIDPLKFPEPALPHHFDSRAEAVIAPLPGADLHNPSGLLHRLEDLGPLGHGEGQWFLTVDVFPGLHCVNDHLRVPVVRCANQDDIHPLVIKQPPIILMPGGDAGVDLLRRRLDLLSDFFVDQRQVEHRLVGVGDCHDVAVFLRPLSNHAALIAKADHAEAGTVIFHPWGGGRPAFRRRASPLQSERGHRRLPEK